MPSFKNLPSVGMTFLIENGHFGIEKSCVIHDNHDTILSP